MTAKPPDNDTSGDSRPIRTYWLTAGTGTIIVALIAALVALKPWSGNPPAPQPTPSQSVSAIPASTSLSPTTRLVFSDRFCTAAFGWTVGNGHTGGRYGSCAFRIYANANDIESSEPRASAVYPAAPSAIEITVTARRLLGEVEGDEFGVACRADGEGYAFTVQSDVAEIIKYSSSTGQIGPPLARVPAAVNMNAVTRSRRHAPLPATEPRS